jgi:hypothetical protein
MNWIRSFISGQAQAHHCFLPAICTGKPGDPRLIILSTCTKRLHPHNCASSNFCACKDEKSCAPSRTWPRPPVSPPGIPVSCLWDAGGFSAGAWLADCSLLSSSDWLECAAPGQLPAGPVSPVWRYNQVLLKEFSHTSSGIIAI